MKRIGSDLGGVGRPSRRQVLGYGASLLAMGLASSPALAQGGGLFQTASAEWQDRFDGASRSTRMPDTSVATLSERVVASTEMAIQDYRNIEARGGWTGVPNDSRLRLGMRHPNVVALRQRLVVSGDLDPSVGMSDTFDSFVEGGVRRFQARHGLIVTGIVAEATLAALNVPADTRRHQLERNLDRLRERVGSLAPRYVMVNIPAADIEAVEQGFVHSRHIGVVGKADRASPVHTAQIVDINFNPYWTVPASIVKKDLIPKMQAEPDYLTKNRIRIYDQKGNELVPSHVDWHSDEATNYMFRQDPGDINSLGSVRINMPNRDAVYMHDTPAKNLFGENARFHSSGCVRVQNVRSLVEWLLKDNPEGWDRRRIDEAIRSGERIDAKLPKPIPTYWVYITAWGGADGIVQFREDIYGQDGLDAVALR